MTRRLLVVLDPDPETAVSTRYAVEIAKAHDGAVTGLALVDRKRIDEAALGGGIGAMYYAEKLRRDLADEIRSEAQVLLQAFVEQVEAAGARHTDDHVADDDVVRGIMEDMKTHDLLVTGQQSHFYYADPNRRTHALVDIVEKGACATLVVQQSYRPIRRVLFAYDGGLPAARTMQKFAHLRPFGTDITLEVLHVRGDGREAELESDRLLEAAASYLQAYDFADVTTTSLPDGSPRDRILQHAEASEADLIVAGAYSATGLKKIFLGSTAVGLIEDSPVPLFLYH